MDYLEPCHYSTRLIEKLQSLDTENILDFKLIDKAIYWAKKYHDGQFRKSGEPFYTHPLEVAYMLSEYKLKTDVIVTAILHDIVEDTKVTAGMILDGFGWRIAEMVDRLTRVRPGGSKISVEEILNNAYEKDDKEVLLIKVVDRLHNMQTIEAKTTEKQNKIAKETIKSFITLAMYYDFHKTKEVLYQLCTKIISNQDNQVESQYLSTAKHFSLPPTFQNEINQMQNKYLK
jgi:guanosine-3',5'-bis(diphosphate) 3'-pyrophosphohydrolase